jgi:hypothetical protein
VKCLFWSYILLQCFQISAQAQLGEYISIANHPKSKSVNLKIKVPDGWVVEEGDRPNIVKKFIKGRNTYLILIKDNLTFISRNQAREILQDSSYINNYINELIFSKKKYTLVSKSIVSVDNYPAIQFEAKCYSERVGIDFELIMKGWIVFYEDKLVFLQSISQSELEFKKYATLFQLISNSVIFPDQYN